MALDSERLCFLKTQTSDYLEYYHSGKDKGKVGATFMPFTSQNLVHCKEEDIWIGATIIGDFKIYMIQGAKTIPEFDSYYKLPYCGPERDKKYHKIF